MIASAPQWALTGYGQQINSLIPRLQADGHEVAMVPLAGFHGGFARISGVDYFPPQDLTDKGNNTIIEAYAKAWDADIVLSLTDAWILTGYGAGKFRWIPWVPVDGDPLGPAVAKVLPQAWRIVSMSRHGERTMREAGFASTFIPHGFEDAFKPDAEARKNFRKEFWGLDDDAFVFGSVGLNYAYPGRKGFDRLMEAFSGFRKGKENVYLYLHTDPRPMSSLDLNAVVQKYHLEGVVLFPKPLSYIIGYTPMTMAAMYNALDCFVLATHGEGFGIPVIEALACGVPVIATDCTSMPELVLDTINGSLVPPITSYMNPGHYNHYLIDTDKLRDAMDDLYHKEFFPGQLGIAVGKAGETHAARFPNLKVICRKTVEQYHWNQVYANLWRPFLTDCENEIRSKTRSADARGGGSITVMEDRVRKTDGPTANLRECHDLLKRLDHPGIIKPNGSGTDEWGRFYYDMPRYAHGLEGEQLSPEDGDALLAGIRDALSYLHGLGIAHRDLHPSNVVFDNPAHPVLIDFAWAKEVPNPRGVDYAPWNHREDVTPRTQLGDMAGYHRIVAHVRGISLEEARATAMPGVPYQQIDGVGERDCDLRWKIMQPDVLGKRVVDFGCNLGWFVGKAISEGARAAFGADLDKATIEAARSLHPQAKFFCGDIEKDDFAFSSDIDVGFCLSVLQHLRDPKSVLARLRETCAVLYVEVPEGVVNLDAATYLGESERGRPIVRFERVRGDTSVGASGNGRSRAKAQRQSPRPNGHQGLPEGEAVAGGHS